MAESNGLQNGVPFTEEQFKQLNELLATRGYLKGFALIKLFKLFVFRFLPSTEDSHMFGILKSSTISAQYPHVARWFKHMEGFSGGEETGYFFCFFKFGSEDRDLGIC